MRSAIRRLSGFSSRLRPATPPASPPRRHRPADRAGGVRSSSCWSSRADTRGDNSPAGVPVRGTPSARPSSSPCVCASIQCRSSKITTTGCFRLSRRTIRLIASSVRCRLIGGSICANGSGPSTMPSKPNRYGSVSSSVGSRVLSESRTFARRAAALSASWATEIAAQQFQHRQPRGSLAVRD